MFGIIVLNEDLLCGERLEAKDITPEKNRVLNALEIGRTEEVCKCEVVYKICDGCCVDYKLTEQCHLIILGTLWTVNFETDRTGSGNRLVYLSGNLSQVFG